MQGFRADGPDGDMMTATVQSRRAWLARRSALMLLVVTASGLAAGGLARLAGAGAVARVTTVGRGGTRSPWSVPHDVPRRARPGDHDCGLRRRGASLPSGGSPSPAPTPANAQCGRGCENDTTGCLGGGQVCDGGLGACAGCTSGGSTTAAPTPTAGWPWASLPMQPRPLLPRDGPVECLGDGLTGRG